MQEFSNEHTAHISQLHNAAGIFHFNNSAGIHRWNWLNIRMEFFPICIVTCKLASIFFIPTAWLSIVPSLPMPTTPLWNKMLRQQASNSRSKLKDALVQSLFHPYFLLIGMHELQLSPVLYIWNFRYTGSYPSSCNKQNAADIFRLKKIEYYLRFSNLYLV